MKPGRLFWKLFLAFGLAASCSFLVGVSIILYAQGSKVTPNGELAGGARHLIESGGLKAALPLLQHHEQTRGSLALYDARGRWVAGNPQIEWDSETQQVRDPDGQAYVLWVRRWIPPPPLRAIPLVVGALVSLIFSAAVAWYLAAPLSHLRRGFQAVGAGQLATRVLPMIGRRRDEIADLAREFDGMATELQQLWGAQQRLFHDVSHELRSPLARLELAIGLLRQTPEKLPDMLERVEREAKRLESLIEQLLTLARLQSGAPLTGTANVDLIDLLNEIVEDARFEARSKDCCIRFDAPTAFVTFANGELLYRAFENVIRNAIKFSPPGGEIVVSVSGVEQLEITVSDRGPGVPADSLNEIFEPFRRLDSGDVSGAGGFGLGLALARQAIEVHGGVINARSREAPGGLDVMALIPLRRR